MSEVITQALYFIGSYIGIIAFFFIGFNWITKGFLFTYVKVKASRGKKTLVECVGLTSDYYKAGQFKNGVFHLIDRDGKGHYLDNVERSDIIHKMGVTFIQYDTIAKKIIRRFGNDKIGSDPVETDNFIKKIITAPQVEDKLIKAILIISVVAMLAAIGALIIGFMNMDLIQQVNNLGVVV